MPSVSPRLCVSPENAPVAALYLSRRALSLAVLRASVSPREPKNAPAAAPYLARRFALLAFLCALCLSASLRESNLRSNPRGAAFANS